MAQAWLSFILNPITNLSVDVMSLLMSVLYVAVMGEVLTPARYTSYWIMLAILHGKTLETPKNLTALRLGRSALFGFTEFFRKHNPEAPVSDNMKQDGTAAPVDESHGIGSMWAGAMKVLTTRTTLDRSTTGIWPQNYPEESPVGIGNVSGTGAPRRLPGGIKVQDCAFSWTEDAPPVLTGVSMDFSPGSFTVIRGGVGTGKTTLLMGLLGETKRPAGSVRFDGSEDRPACSYVPQNPWLQNASIRDNIVFDQCSQKFDPERYEAACRSCCLLQDFAQLLLGDQTLAGDGGANLSGGQRQRVSLARAAYSRSAVVLLDDVLSALDPPVASRVYSDCLMGMMGGRTRVLVSHAESIASRADQVFEIDGSIGAVVPVAAFAVGLDDALGVPAPGTDDKKTLAMPAPILIAAAEDATIADGVRHSTPGWIAELSTFYHGYAEGVGGAPSMTLVVVLFALEIAVVELGVFYMAELSQRMENEDSPDITFYLGLYTLSVILELSFAFVRQAVLVVGTQRQHRGMLDQLLDQLLNSDVSFFDKTPVADVIRWFSHDAQHCDALMTQQASDSFGYGFGYATVVCCAIVVVLPWMAIGLGAAGCAAYLVRRRFAPRIAEVDTTSFHVSVFRTFVEMMFGLPTIRATTAQLYYVARFQTVFVRGNQQMVEYWTTYSTMFMLLEVISGMVVSGVVLALGLNRDTVSSGNAAFALLNVCFIHSMTHMFITHRAELSRIIAERKKLQGAIPTPTDQSAGRTDVSKAAAEPAAARTFSGVSATIEFADVSLRYSPQAPLAAKQLSFVVPGGQRVGIVGRTGAGKSTLFRAITALMPPATGTIRLNGVDIGDVPEAELRSGIMMIPQRPHLFAGSIRFNLDPNGKFNDGDIWGSLQDANIDAFVRGLPGQLDAMLASTGSNLSAGQAQLICLARGIMRKAHIVLLDEATANLDDELLGKVEDVLGSSTFTATVIQIAHQTSSVMNCDRVIVMDGGQIVEDGPPFQLLADASGMFRALYNADARRQKVDGLASPLASSPGKTPCEIVEVPTAGQESVV